MPSVTLSVAATGLFYVTEICMEEEDHYWKKMVYHTLNAMLYLGCICFAIDAGLYLMDKEYFCQIQREPVMADCEKRNEYLVSGMIGFYILGVPIIWTLNSVIKRYADGDKETEKGKMEQIIKRMQSTEERTHETQE